MLPFSRPSSPGRMMLDITYISGSVLRWDVRKYNASHAVSVPHQYSNCTMPDGYGTLLLDTSASEGSLF